MHVDPADLHDPDDAAMLDPREVDALIARAVAYCEHAGIALASPERAREFIGEWGRIIAAASEGDPPTKP